MILLACLAVGRFADAAVAKDIDFAHEVLPILKKHCAECHTDGKYEGGLSMDTRGMILESEAVVVGKSGESGLIERILSDDPDERMPPKGDRLTEKEVKVLRDWIDGGLVWERGFTFRKFPVAPLEPRIVELPPATAELKNPIDRLVAKYDAKHKLAPVPLADDRTFARRVYLDLNGLLPPVDELEAFVADKSPDKRAALVDKLLSRNKAYTEHWLTFWSDMLRSAYRGTGFIDGGRKRIDHWLYAALYNNMPYDTFVRELITGTGDRAGFINGIKWRGNVNESQRPEMQAAQSVGQVFMGTNLKCASCHDSFVNQWKLADAYALANVFSNKPLELHRCDKPTGKPAEVRFIYPQLGAIDANANRTNKMAQLASIIVKPENGRLRRTIVNRLWTQLMGRGIVEPVDDLDQPPFSSDLLDWLAADLATNGHDLKHTLRTIATSRVYQRQAAGAPRPDAAKFVFRGPLVKRMNAEMFSDAVSSLTNNWSGRLAAKLPKVSPSNEPRVGVRASLTNEDTLTRVLGRPNREQVVTRRESIATTLEAIELTNGSTLDKKLRSGAGHWLKQSGKEPTTLIDQTYQAAIGRSPSAEEREIAVAIIGKPVSTEGVADLLWVLTMLPEFQLIH
ncbi:MAG: PSD1 and planctomycete cytochrome C domain-containing protein [Pirellulales bacterium]|nr:PSD1 and planctomycete cytochrome C domain-containing protein [Pirellulales bacterium]